MAIIRQNRPRIDFNFILTLYFVKNVILYLDLILRKVTAMINITNDRGKLQDKVNIWRPQFY